MGTLLPPPEIQFIDANGNPLASGTIETYVPSTTTPKDTWQDSGQTVLNTNPIVLDSAGRAIIYGSGIYRFIVKDASGNLVYDQLTADTAVGGIANGGVSTGTPNAQVVTASSFSSQDGQVVLFVAGFSNSGPLTVNLGGGPIPVLADSPLGPVALSGGEVIADNQVLLGYEAARGAFHLLTPAWGTMSAQNANAVAITGGTIAGTTMSNNTFVVKQASDPSPTAEGDMQWSTLFNNFKVGDGAATKRFWAGPAPGSLYGCTIANNASDATNDVDFAAGVAVDSTNAFYMTAGALTKRLDANWAVGSNQGGLFSGAAANTTYHCFVIMRPDTGVVDAGFDTSVTAANRPADYTYYRRVGSIVRAGGAIKAFLQSGDYFYWSVQANDVTTTNPGTAAVSATLTVPLGISVIATIIAGVSDGDSAGPRQMLISALDQTNSVPTLALSTIFWETDASAVDYFSTSTQVVTNTSGQIRYRVSGSGAGLIARINTVGWTDPRGRTA